MPPENRRADGTVYESGTVWELDDARTAGRDVWIYRCCEAPKVALNDPEKTQKEEQYRCLEAFVAGSRAPDGSLRFGVHEFLHDQQFSGLVREHLRQFVSKVAPSTVPTPRPAVSAPAAGGSPQVSAADLADRLDRLIQLCDREDVSDLFTAKMRQRVKLAKPGGGLLCILPGGTREGHRGFLERVREYEMRHQIPGVQPEQVVLVQVVGKLPLTTPETLGVSILRGIREGVRNPDLESWRDLQRWMNAEKCRIFILALEPTAEVIRGRERVFLDNAAVWLGRWVDKAASHLFVLVACLRYEPAERGAGQMSEQERVRQEVEDFTPPLPIAGLMPEIVKLPELPPITFDEWDACVAAGGCRYKGDDSGWGRGRRPVIKVTPTDARNYVVWLSKKTGEKYRLLSEAEWEYAARAGSTDAYPWGKEPGTNRANFYGSGSQWSGKRTALVGSFAVNKFGLHDMIGNVVEWVEDCYHNRYFGAPADGSDWGGRECRTGEQSHEGWTVAPGDTEFWYYVQRGGSWHDNSRRARSAKRGWGEPGDPLCVQGFRVAKTLP